MAMDIQIEFDGLDRLIAKLTGPMIKTASERVITKAALTGESEGKRRAPVDTGNLRTSMTHKVDGLQGWFGTNRLYGKFLDQPSTRSPTYRGGPFSGSSTSGWLTEKSREQVLSRMGEFMGQEARKIESEWGS